MTKAPVRPRRRADFVTGLSEQPSFNPVAQTPDNMVEKALVDLNFKVSEEFRQEFKIAAAVAGIKNKELLIEAFELWKKSRAAK